MLRIDFRELVAKIEALAWVSESVKDDMAKLASLDLYRERETVYFGKDRSEHFHIVISGSLEFYHLNKGEEELEDILYEGQSFGTQFVFENELSKETLVTTTTQTLLLSFPVAAVQKLIADCPQSRPTLAILMKHYNTYQFVRSATTFGEHLSPRSLIDFVSSFEKRTYEPNVYVFKKGDDPDGFYICLKGRLKVLIPIPDKGELEVARLRSGDFFGELALTNSAKRAASIAADQYSECYFLSRERFDALVKKEPYLLSGFATLAKLAY